MTFELQKASFFAKHKLAILMSITFGPQFININRRRLIRQFAYSPLIYFKLLKSKLLGEAKLAKQNR